MTREKKFRQRNKNNGQWHYWGFIDGKWIEPYQTDNYESPQDSDQFTGLKDKNGKEIYEGDIVEMPSYAIPFLEFLDGNLVNTRSIKRKKTGVIRVEVVKLIGGVGFKKDNSEIVQLAPTTIGGNVPWKVLGNIYENPELIK